MTFEEAKQRFEPILDNAMEMPANEVQTFNGIIGGNLARWTFTGGLTLADFDITYVIIPPQYSMPITQRHAVVKSRKTGKAYMTDLSLAVLGGGYVMAGEFSNLSK